MIQANPKDLVVRLDEAGKLAEVERDSDGTDSRSTWYEVLYEREGTGSRFYQGPVTVYSKVYIGKDIEAARQTYQEEADRTESMPEANRRVGDKFELDGAGDMGDEGFGLSACERSCNARGEIYVHKRLVSRVSNVVSVVYLWGLSHKDGISDWHAHYFGNVVLGRVRAHAQ